MRISVHGNRDDGFVLLRALIATGIMLVVFSSVMFLYTSLGRSISHRIEQTDSVIADRNKAVYALLEN